MPLKLLAQGNQLMDIREAEQVIPEGAKTELRLYLRESAPAWVISGLDTALKVAGVPLRGDVVQEASIISIKWTKGFAWLPVIATIIVGTLILAALIIAWQILQEVAENPLLWIPLVLLGIGVYLLVTNGSKRRSSVRRQLRN